jgi:hypothetical protein
MSPYLEEIKTIALALGELKNKVVFIGGSVVGLYVDTQGAEEPRPTKDIDLTLQLLHYGDWALLEEQLATLNFMHSPDENILCRYFYKGIMVDIMPSNENILGFSNIWYHEGIDEAIEYQIEPLLFIRIFPCSYFLASKIEAYKGRGNDLRWSQDFEDIIYIFNNREQVVKDILNSKPHLLEYFQKEFLNLIKHPSFEEALNIHLYKQGDEERIEFVKDKIRQILV